MIKANDLRINNWVKVSENGLPFQITAHSFCLLDRMETVESDYLPIPLSPEILLNCGFEKNRQHHAEFFITVRTNYFLIKLGYKFKHEGDYYQEIKYLHQLQNLYFAIVGEELHYKPPL